LKGRDVNETPSSQTNSLAEAADHGQAHGHGHAHGHGYPPPDIDLTQPGIVILPDDGKPGMWDNPDNLKKLLRIFFISCGFMILLDLLFVTHLLHKHLSFKDDHPFAPEGWFGFYSLYGLLACVVLVLIAKQLRKVLMRSEDYYDGPSDSPVDTSKGGDHHA